MTQVEPSFVTLHFSGLGAVPYEPFAIPAPFDNRPPYDISILKVIVTP